MSRASVWIGRGVLAVLLVFAAAGVLDPAQRLAAITIRGDRVNHCLLSYAITLGLMASFPAARSWLLAALVLAIGVALETAQAFGLFAGDAQLGDLVADFSGVFLAFGPLLIGRARAHIRALGHADETG